jgi:hypothetical protein
MYGIPWQNPVFQNPRDQAREKRMKKIQYGTGGDFTILNGSTYQPLDDSLFDIFPRKVLRISEIFVKISESPKFCVCSMHPISFNKS